MVIYVNLLSEFLVVRKSSCIYCLMLRVYNKQTQRQQTELIIDTGEVHLLDLVVSIYYGQGCLKRFFPDWSSTTWNISKISDNIDICDLHIFRGNKYYYGYFGKFSLILRKSASEMGIISISILLLIFEIFLVEELQSKKALSDNPGHNQWDKTGI